MSEEEKKALEPHIPSDDEKTIFDRIVANEIPSAKVYEDDKVLAFRDISPQAPVHIILIPKERQGLTRLIQAEERHKAILGHLLWAAAEVARKENLSPG